MSCPICNRVLCDHSPAERGQTHGEMMDDYDEDVADAERLSRVRSENEEYDPLYKD